MNLPAMCLTLALAVPTLATPCLAGDPPLAGRRLIVDHAGQPFCTDIAQLRGVVRAGVARVPNPYAGFASCSPVPINTSVEVIEDLSPDNPTMHIVKVRVASIFAPIEGYTYSVGLYPPILRGLPPPPLPYE